MFDDDDDDRLPIPSQCSPIEIVDGDNHHDDDDDDGDDGHDEGQGQLIKDRKQQKQGPEEIEENYPIISTPEEPIRIKNQWEQQLGNRLKFYAKGVEKCKLLSSIFHQSFIDLDTVGCPTAIEIKNMYEQEQHSETTLFNGTESDKSLLPNCTSFPVKHKNLTHHCAQKKAQLFGFWVNKFLNI